MNKLKNAFVVFISLMTLTTSLVTLTDKDILDKNIGGLFSKIITDSD